MRHVVLLLVAALVHLGALPVVTLCVGHEHASHLILGDDHSDHDHAHDHAHAHPHPDETLPHWCGHDIAPADACGDDDCVDVEMGLDMDVRDDTVVPDVALPVEVAVAATGPSGCRLGAVASPPTFGAPPLRHQLCCLLI